MAELLALFLGMVPSILMIVAPILIAAIGGMICERAGVVNIALEGLMAFGAMAAATSHRLLESPAGSYSVPLALILGAAIGGIFSLVHAFASITLKADQVISGTGLNLLANGLTVFFCQIIFQQERSQPFKLGMMPLPWLGGVYPTALIALGILIASWYGLYKRPWGLRLRSCGEHPQAAASAGIDVIRIRYMAVLISGILAGLAGACLVLTQTIQYTVTTINGKGFIALAAVSFGRWLPLGVLGSSLLFGTSVALAVYIINIDFLKFLPPEFFNILPYAITLITLVFFSGKDYAPRASGQPYEKG
ncbi:MAG: ABC transporter permease [Spirochaetaceae bacterium]|jgi:simple sugar transport system permease protein|nr:ABC transporter permease [Spirochaetaceae bacterium]